MSIRLSDSVSHQSNVRSGTRFYSAPEVQHHRLHPGSDVYSYGVMLWEFQRGHAPYVIERGADGAASRLVPHPDYLIFDPKTPLTYTLLAKACLSTEPHDRPTFEQAKVVLQDLDNEVASGSYVASSGTRVVCLDLGLTLAKNYSST